MKPRLIAFCGVAGVGKTTAAEYLVRAHSFKRMSFADPIRDMLRAMGISDYYLSTGKHQPHHLLAGKTAREAMQSLGTEWGRQRISEQVWLGIARHRIESAIACGSRVVLDDCRFDNEAEMVRSMGGLVVALTRPGVVRTMGHASEAGIWCELTDRLIESETIEHAQAKLNALVNDH